MLKLRLKTEVNLFLIALGFLSRIPVPKNLDFSQQNMNRASRYFSLVGWGIGFICALSFYLASQFLPVSIAIVVSMIVGFFLTGGFHEDGLADTCDGLGGGWEVEDKLKIMKDSRIGSYGSLALWSMLSLKFFLLFEIANTHSYFGSINVFVAILLAHPLSRSLSTALIFVLPYVSDDETAKSKPLAESGDVSDLMINLFIGCSALLIFSKAAALIVLSQIVLFVFLKWLYSRQVKGFTGDMLGAAQQVSEVLLYTAILISLMPRLAVVA